MAARSTTASGDGQLAVASPEEDALLARWQSVWNRSRDARSIADVIGTTLSSAIVQRELPPGFRLREERLANLVSVSRTPIREALAGLATKACSRW
jgi:hypothetical protein